jgi:hypothetical protein
MEQLHDGLEEPEALILSIIEYSGRRHPDG